MILCVFFYMYLAAIWACFASEMQERWHGRSVVIAFFINLILFPIAMPIGLRKVLDYFDNHRFRC